MDNPPSLELEGIPKPEEISLVRFFLALSLSVFFLLLLRRFVFSPCAFHSIFPRQPLFRVALVVYALVALVFQYGLQACCSPFLLFQRCSVIIVASLYRHQCRSTIWKKGSKSEHTEKKSELAGSAFDQKRR